MVDRTLKAITDGFTRLIGEVDFQKITVDMIMKEAGISRSTFYRLVNQTKEAPHE